MPAIPAVVEKPLAARIPANPVMPRPRNVAPYALPGETVARVVVGSDPTGGITSIEQTWESAEDRRGWLVAHLEDLAGRHGVADLEFALDVVKQDRAAAGPSVRHAVPYTCEIVHETPRALLGWIPSEENHLRGQGVWIPRTAIVQRDEVKGRIERVTVSRPLEWWAARRRGSDRIERVGP